MRTYQKWSEKQKVVQLEHKWELKSDPVKNERWEINSWDQKWKIWYKNNAIIIFDAIKMWLKI